jgi:hypothetical protein
MSSFVRFLRGVFLMATVGNDFITRIHSRAAKN